MPLGTRIHAKAVPEALSFSAQFFSGFGAISARLLGAKIGLKVRKSRSGVRTGFRPDSGTLGIWFWCHFGEAFGSQNRPKREKKAIRIFDGFRPETGDHGMTPKCIARHYVHGPGRTFGGGQERQGPGRTDQRDKNRKGLGSRSWKTLVGASSTPCSSAEAEGGG